MRAAAIAGVQVEYFESQRDWAGKGNLYRIRSNLTCEARFAAALARGFRPDIFHVHVADGPSFWRKWAYMEQARLTGRPVVMHLHGAQFEQFTEASTRNRQAVLLMLERADLVLALHHGIADQILQWTDGRATVEILYNPVIVDQFDPAPERTQHTVPTVLMMGEIGDRKGAFDLAATIPDILARVPDARFAFGGNGEVDRLRDTVAQLGVSSHVDVMGWVSGDRKLQAFRDADVYCLPSYNENLPVSILEAMASRLPVVSTRVAGTPEEVIDGETGFLIDPGDRMALSDRLVRLLQDTDLRTRMGEAGRARVDVCFENEVVVDRLRTLWEQVVDQHAATSESGRRRGDHGSNR